MKKFLKTACLLALLGAAPTVYPTFVLTIQEAWAESTTLSPVGRFAHATRAAVCGPAWDNGALWTSGEIHHFNVKKANFIPSVDRSILWVTGRIEHRIAFWPDDDVDYEITYEITGNGLRKLKSVEVTIDAPLLFVLEKLQIARSGQTRITPNMVNQNTSEALPLVGDNWEDCVEILIKNIAIAASNPNFCGIRVEEATVDGFRLDWCRWWSKDCGKPAADAYCVSKGYSRSSHWEIDQHIGAVTATKILEPATSAPRASVTASNLLSVSDDLVYTAGEES